MTLSLGADQLDRYSRHILLDDIGPEGQAALLECSVLVVGAGGLGSPVVQYLAAAGVGRLGIADHDSVEASNLQRQVLHGSEDVGRPKVDSAADFVAALNPDVTVRTYPTRVTAANALDLVEAYDVVVDASDTFQTRYLLNDACVLADCPLVHGAVDRFQGQVFTVDGGRPCYRCLFPEAPPAGTVPDCSTRGVLGVLPGVVGAIQATEVLKLVLDVGETLDGGMSRERSSTGDGGGAPAGRLLVYDAATLATETVPVAGDPDCPVCGESPRVDALDPAHYEGRCSIPE